MGTNYYFKLNSELEITTRDGKQLPDIIKWDMLNSLYDNSMIHIGKRSRGWKPLFRKTQYYSSVSEILDFYENSKEFLSIYNEYDEELTVDELCVELIDWNKHSEDAKEHMVRRGVYYDLEGYQFYESEFF